MAASVTSANTLTFKPLHSNAGFGMLIPGAILLLIDVALVALAGFLPGWVVILYGTILLVFAIALLGFGLFFRRVTTTMRYELSASTLNLIAGPVHYTIPLASIKRVYNHNIFTGISNSPRTNVANAVNTPGLALANVTWKDIGLLKMCGTPERKNGWQRVMLIQTDKYTYGITPLDEAGFLSALRAAGVTVEEEQ